MDMHPRYLQQAAWTRDLRDYVFGKVGLTGASRVLEVGCGTGAILSELHGPASIYGLDLDPSALVEAHIHAPAASLTRGNALRLPFPDSTFDIVFCHFLLLWVTDPLAALLEMKRVTKLRGTVAALAEPDYTARVDQPAALALLGRLQTESLRTQGADVSLGAHLADLFDRAGIRILETGVIQSRKARVPTPDEREKEWAVVEADLSGLISEDELRRLKSLDEKAWASGKRVLNVPTYFAWGKV